MRRTGPRLALVTLTGAALVAIGLVASATQAASSKHRGPKPERVRTNSDRAKAKLDRKLRDKVEEGSNETVHVFVTVADGAAPVKALLDDAAAAETAGGSIVVGATTVQKLPKLADSKGVVSVGLVELKKTGRPLGVPDPELDKRLSRAKLNAALKGLYRREVPYDKAPPLKGSNFDALKELGVLDAKTHGFADAWKAGYTGEGVTVGVLDGGTDWGHPDLIGTWQTWSGAADTETIDDGWNGWPKAFDPYGTLVWLVAPSFVDEGLTWYTWTESKTCSGGSSTCRVSFDTKTGPSRNFAAPSGTVDHTYRFPRRWSKSGTVRLGSHPDDHLLALFGERPAFLVVDSTSPSVYDRVYVDLDGDYRFDDEKPVTKDSPVSYRDMDGDGYTDISGGLVYYVSDGATRIPGGLTSFLGPDTPAPGSGELLAWTGDFDPAIGGHGTLTASNVAGQGVINGLVPTFRDLPGGTVPGAVIGGSPRAKLAPFGDIYFAFEFSTQFGYFLSVGRGIDVTSNSYGASDADNDGFDAASQEADIWHAGRRTTPFFSTGNGAPGFGTIAPPIPSAGVAVGASTQFGGTGWDSIVRTSQIVDNDVAVWSNRGPAATGAPGVDLVADGAFSSGDITLNAVLDGRVAWETWGGTSRSAPVAASVGALVYQSYKQSHGGAVPAGFYGQVEDIVKSSARDLGYDGYIQGAGSVDAARAVRAAAGTGPVVTPTEWRVGDYRGDEWPVFTHVIEPGGTDTQTFTLAGGSGSWRIDDRVMRRVDTDRFTFSSSDVERESPYNFNAPDYLIDLTRQVREHRDADLMVVRVNFPHDQFDGNADYVEDQAWRLLTYNWTDVDHDGRLWRDRDRDGVVDHVDKETSSEIDGDLDIDFRRSEIDEGEYVRFMYHRAGANALMSFVRDPKERMADGLFVGLQHSARDPAIATTDFTIQIDWYENRDWRWVTTPSSASGSFSATVKVPPDVPYGMYSGAIVLRKGRDSMVVPVSVAVAAELPQDGEGAITDSLAFGGEDVAEDQEDSLYNNGSVFGAGDWTWREESGDWRFFFFDVGTEPPTGTLFLTDTTWNDAAPFTDLDTLVFGRSENHYQLAGDGAFGAPYILDAVGSSQNANVGGGVWLFDTATGGAREVVVAPAQEGLHAIVQHQVGWDGGKFHVPFETRVGSASVSPSSVTITTASDAGSFDVTFEASVDLDGLSVEAFGLSQPETSQEPVAQDDPNDPSTASAKKDLAIDHASRLTVTTSYPTEDIDLYLVYDANGDGAFNVGEIVASSAGTSADESIELTRPPDGDYQIWLHGFGVSGTPSVDLLVDAVQGTDLTVSGVPAGAVPAGTPVALHVDFSKSMVSGEEYFGELLLGPTTAPSALTVPISITRS